jgi:hypothetical protein
MSNLAERIAALPPEKRAALKRKLLAKREGSRSNVITPQPRSGQPFPLSFAQERLWFIHQWNPHNPAHNISLTIRIKGQLDLDLLLKSCAEIILRHEPLRTTFEMAKGTSVQIVSPTPPLVFALVDLEQLAAAEQETLVPQLVREEARQPFDLTTGPVYRALMLRLDAQAHVLVLTTHHIVTDGWSLQVLVRELGAAYTGFVTGTPVRFADLPIQYVDYAVWQRQNLQGAELEKQIAYWKQQLDPMPAVLELPTDRPRPPVQTYCGASYSFTLSRPLTEAIKALSRREGTTLFMTLLAAFKTLLYRYCGQKDIVVGSPIANRNRAEIEDLVGFFVNMLVLRTDFSGDPNFGELLKRVREISLAAFTHCDMPFEKLVEELHPERDMSRNPLFQVVFAFQDTLGGRWELPGLTLDWAETENGVVRFDLTLFMADMEQGLAGRVNYNTDLYDAETITQMMEHFVTILEQVTAHPEIRLLDISLVQPGRPAAKTPDFPILEVGQFNF